MKRKIKSVFERFSSQRILKLLYPISLPLLFGIYPALYLYAQNASILLISSFIRIMLLYFLLIIIIYCIFLVFNKGRAVQSANATIIFLFFFNIYGIVYEYLLKLDVIRIEHYTLLPFLLFLLGYLLWLVNKINLQTSLSIWKTILIIFIVLTTYNVIEILPQEIKKSQEITNKVEVSNTSEIDESLPDIYYIVFDEFAGFKSMQEYWHYQGADRFKQFLINNDFFVVDECSSNSDSTLHELSIRLNYQNYPPYYSDGMYSEYFGLIANNKVSAYLKNHGYTTIAFEESARAFPANQPYQADYLFERNPNLPDEVSPFLDDYAVLVVDNTMAIAFSNYYKTNILDSDIKNHNNFINYTIDQINGFEGIQPPKFVYVHLLLPHVPFMFDKNGRIIDSKYKYDWNYYLGNYIYTIKIAEQMVDDIIAKSDPDRQPIIILQSDHGARNQIIYDNEETLLKNFPEEFKYDILFAMYIPGYSFDGFPKDMNPINTFPIIFNYLFDDNIPLQ